MRLVVVSPLLVVHSGDVTAMSRRTNEIRICFRVVMTVYRVDRPTRPAQQSVGRRRFARATDGRLQVGGIT